MGSYRDRGVVLRTHRLGETDRIVHLLTVGRGKVRAVAKGVRRPGSRFGGRLEPYGYVEMQLYEGRNLDIVTQAELIEPHAAVRSDYVRSAAAAVMVELADQVVQEGDAVPEVLDLLLAGLGSLEAAPPDPSVFVDAYLLRLAGLVGFPAAAESCARCGAAGPHVFLSVRAGGVLCADCAPAGTRAVAPEVIAVLVRLAAVGEWASLPALAREDPAAHRTAGSYARAFVEHHLDRRLRSYDHVPRP